MNNKTVCNCDLGDKGRTDGGVFKILLEWKINRYIPLKQYYKADMW